MTAWVLPCSQEFFEAVFTIYYLSFHIFEKVSQLKLGFQKRFGSFLI